MLSPISAFETFAAQMNFLVLWLTGASSDAWLVWMVFVSAPQRTLFYIFLVLAVRITILHHLYDDILGVYIDQYLPLKACEPSSTRTGKWANQILISRMMLLFLNLSILSLTEIYYLLGTGHCIRWEEMMTVNKQIGLLNW